MSRDTSGRRPPRLVLRCRPLSHLVSVPEGPWLCNFTLVSFSPTPSPPDTPVLSCPVDVVSWVLVLEQNLLLTGDPSHTVSSRPRIEDRGPNEPDPDTREDDEE